MDWPSGTSISPETNMTSIMTSNMKHKMKHKMKPQKRTLVLTSQQNFVWQSMQEIIPFIVKSWQDLADDTHSVQVVDLDKERLPDFFQNLLLADNIILTCFVPQIFRLARVIRNELSLPARFFVHLHNQATIACWPMRIWGGKDLFRESDVFISSCTRDVACLKKTFPTALTTIIPFSKELISFTRNANPSKTTIPFIFIGRISEQKNIHTLFLSLSLLQEKNPEIPWTLELIGQEDRLGSPNMGRPGSGHYEQDLLDLSCRLKIRERVHFYGLKTRTEIDEILTRRRVIFSIPSLHSDENFGMCAFQCLIGGHLACLSDWGGHTDFQNHFPDQVFLTGVYRTPRGPLIHPIEYMEALRNAAARYHSEFPAPFPRYYSFDSILSLNRSLALSPQNEAISLATPLATSLPASDLANRVLARVPEQMTAMNPPIFNSYEDLDSLEFFEAYGMLKALPPRDEARELFKVPWMGQDPHRGDFTETSQEWLYERGYLYQETQRNSLL